MTAPASSSTATSTARPNLLLAAILLGVVVVPTGVSGTGVALPHIAADLGSNPALLQWVVNGFNLTFAVFSLVAGSIADHLGRRRGLVLGGALFAGAAVLSAVAPSLLLLDIGRALAGVGAVLEARQTGAGMGSGRRRLHRGARVAGKFLCETRPRSSRRQ